MIIINATTKVKSVMADNGTMFPILPGKESQAFVATKQLIIAATQLGTPKEIGIVTGGSYEFEIAKTIPVAAPYLYTDLEEAKAKLIDPNMDYSVKKEASADILVKQQLLDRTKELNEAKESIAKLEAQLAAADSNELTNKLNEIIAEKTKQNDTLSKRIKELETQLKSANENEQSLRLELNEMTSNYNKSTNSLEALRKDYANEVAQKEQYKKDLESLPSADKISQMQDQVLGLQNTINDKDAEIKRLNEEIASYPSKDSISGNQEEVDQLRSTVEEKDAKIKQLQEGLSGALSDIELMRNSFNEACQKFNIYKDESGNWVQGAAG